MTKGFNKDGEREIGDFTKSIMWACIVLVYLVVSVGVLYRFVGLWVLTPVPYFLYMLAISVRFSEDNSRGKLGIVRLEGGNKSFIIEYDKGKTCWLARLETKVVEVIELPSYYEDKKSWQEGGSLITSFSKKDGKQLFKKESLIVVNFPYELTGNDVSLLLSVLMINRKDGIFNAEFLRAVLEIVVQERGHFRFVAFVFLARSIRKRGHVAGFVAVDPSPPLSEIELALEKYDPKLIEFENL